jgi:hypothetical protein
MTTALYIFLVVLVLTAAYVSVWLYRALKFHGKMLVTCPETLKPAAVKVGIGRATLASLSGRLKLRLSECSRWPERGECDQDCLIQVERDPEGHRVWTIASHWFEGKQCAYCGKPIQPLAHLDHRPALMGSEKLTAEWDEVPAEKLPELFASARAVCWGCHMTETFIREHPDLVVFRPWKKGGPIGQYVPENRPDESTENRRAS